MITNKGKILPIAENTAMQSRDWPDSDAIVHHKNSIQAKKKKFDLSYRQNKENIVQAQCSERVRHINL